MSENKSRCPNCQNPDMTRVARRGFLQERVYAKLGLYPWECVFCREVFLLKSRGRRSRKTSSHAAEK